MSIYVVPILILAILIFAKIKKVDCYDSFVNGAKKSFDLCKNIFPVIAAIMIAISLLRASGALTLLTSFVSPAFELLGMPSGVAELVLLRPFTGSGSLAILKNIITEYGVDSFVARCASTIMGSSETVFYVASVYFSKTSVKRLLYAIPVALVCSLVSSILACLFCRIF